MSVTFPVLASIRTTIRLWNVPSRFPGVDSDTIQ